jgi:hypothetical protein
MLFSMVTRSRASLALINCYVVILALSLLLGGCYPLAIRSLPGSKISVVDTQGNPVKGAQLTLVTRRGYIQQLVPINSTAGVSVYRRSATKASLDGFKPASACRKWFLVPQARVQAAATPTRKDPSNLWRRSKFVNRLLHHFYDPFPTVERYAVIDHRGVVF